MRDLSSQINDEAGPPAVETWESQPLNHREFSQAVIVSNGILSILNFSLKGFISENSEVIGIGSFLVASSVFFSLEVF